MVLNIRDNTLTDEESVTATIFTSPCGFEDPTSTGISATVDGPVDDEHPNCFATGFGIVPVNQGTLLSVQITTDGEALLQAGLDSGVAVTVFLTVD
ncbi:MAG: hypothetical protein VB071_08500 [Lawsonibacter sp.]|nr:hypothetical protein [Lawsonibacter sp.]